MSNIRTETAQTFTVTIFMAGDIEQAKQVCREYCYEIGLCVTIEPTCYIYTGGEEAGFKVCLINYPRFPSSPGYITEKAVALAENLRDRLFQHSFAVVTPEKTIWNTRREVSQ